MAGVHESLYPIDGHAGSPGLMPCPLKIPHWVMAEPGSESEAPEEMGHPNVNSGNENMASGSTAGRILLVAKYSAPDWKTARARGASSRGLQSAPGSLTATGGSQSPLKLSQNKPSVRLTPSVDCLLIL